MRRVALLVVLIGFALPLAAQAKDRYLGTITVASTSTAVDNTSTATPFTIPTGYHGTWVRIQCDQAAFITFDGTAATSSNGEQYDAAQLSFPQWMNGSTKVSVVGVTSTSTNCKVWAVDVPVGASHP